MMTKEPAKRPPLYLLTGLVIGLLLGCILSFIAFPLQVASVGPSHLAEEHQDQYRLMIALAYASSGDISRAQARLAQLGDADPARALSAQAQLALGNSATQREARALASLARDLDTFQASAQSTSVAIHTPNPDDVDAAPTPFVADEGGVYTLSSRELLCESSEAPPLVKLFIFDENGQAQAGVRIAMHDGEESSEFFTGARPEFGPGYAEYEMTPGNTYILSIAGTETLAGLQPAACITDAGDPAWGAWLLLFNRAKP
ncbi:MAG: hypothetical protein KIT08_02130 [Anaerolineales bacterium]|nr:MAG: hypothetical protein KIT08_02130 [Anaerolineales bacterium]